MRQGVTVQLRHFALICAGLFSVACDDATDVGTAGGGESAPPGATDPDATVSDGTGGAADATPGMPDVGPTPGRPDGGETPLPDGASVLPDTAVALPDAAIALPDAAGELPDAAVALPDAAPVLPDAAPTPPDAAVPAPDAAVPAPDAAVPAPDVAVLEPDAAVAEPDAAVPEPDAAVPEGPPACDPPLAIEPADTAALPLDLRTFSAAGGSGRYRFRLENPEAGGLVNLLTGAYLSGDAVGTVDRIHLTDTACAGEAVATVRIVDHLHLAPSGGVLPAGATFTFDVTGGSGDLFFSFLGLSGSGGAISPDGHYEVGPGSGTDRIRVEDRTTGESLTLTFEVRPTAPLTAQPARVAIPLGSRFRPTVLGGTGEHLRSLEGDAVHLDGDTLVADVPGAATLRVRDPFAATEVRVPIDVVAPLAHPQPRAGDSGFFPVPAAPGDIDGDGVADAVLGVSEADVAALNGGAVYVYRGSPAGLDPAPVRVLSGAERRDEFGRAVATADFDGDGWVDLAVGAPGADVGAGDAGAVYLYRGEPGGFFSADPWLVLSSRVGSDRTGQSLAVCDFNGDGRLDLAVGAPLAEDRTAIPQAADQGAVFLWLGYPDGFTERADQKIYGQFPDGAGGWRGQAGVRYGTWLSAGDFDGDGLCDLAGSSTTYGSVAPRTADGFALLHLGVGPGPAGPGGLTVQPVRAWAGLSDVDADASFGRITAMGDLDRDGFADLAVGQINHDRVAGRNDNEGAIRIFRGGPVALGEPSVLRAAETADRTFEGNAAGDQLGLFVRIADADGDGFADLLSGDWRDEVADGTVDVGLVAVRPGLAGSLPEPLPTRVFAGRAREERLGTAVTPIGDLDGDGRPDLLSHLARANEEGFEVGAPVYLPGDPAQPMVVLTNPGQASGQEVGRGVSVVGDLDGDGLPETLVGIDNGDSALQGINAGFVTLHRGTAAGPEAVPFLELRGFAGHSGSDQLGVAASPAGDFDGDGRPDVAVLARSEDRPAAFPAGYAGDAACAGSLPDGGAVFVWRGDALVAGAAASVAPAAVYFVPRRSGSSQAIAGGFDANGDGLDDLLVGSELFDNVVNGTTLTDTGAFALVLGRPLAAGAIRVLCDAALEGVGGASPDSLGRAVTGIGDLDGDGCDEFAVGAYREAAVGRAAAGVVRVFRGFGGPGCPMTPQYLALSPALANENAGQTLAGGGDVDGDGVPDLVVGAPGHVRGALSTGAAYVLPGAWLRAQIWRPYAAGEPPVEILSFGAAGGAWRVEGDANGERFGAGLALVPPPPGGVRWGVAAGGVLGEFNGVSRSGGVRVYRALPDGTGMEALPVAALGGETGRVVSRFGEALGAGRFGDHAYVIVGAPEASGNSLDAGAVYAFPVW